LAPREHTVSQTSISWGRIKPHAGKRGPEKLIAYQTIRKKSIQKRKTPKRILRKGRTWRGRKRKRRGGRPSFMRKRIYKKKVDHLKSREVGEGGTG